MAKERRKSQNDIEVKQFSDVEKQYIIANFKNETVAAMANSLKASEEDVKAFISDLIKKPGAGLSKATFAQKKGVIASTQVSSERGDSHKNNASARSKDFQQFSGAIHRPQG